MYEYYRNGNFVGYRIQRTVTDENGNKKIETFFSKTTVIHCKRQHTKRLKEIEQAKKRKTEFDFYASNYYTLYVENANLSKSYKDSIKNAINNHIIPYFHNKQLTEITNEDCQLALYNLKGYSKQHIIFVRKIMKRIFAKALKQELIKTNPAYDLILPEYTENKRRSLTDDERRLILQVSKYHPAGAMVMTMLTCGLRPIEIQKMQWDWIDFEKHMIKVKESKTEAGKRRNVPIIPNVEIQLKELQKNDKTYVFDILDNSWSRSKFYRIWHDFLNEMKRIDTTDCIGEDLSPYILRHTFCTDCQTAGVPINVAREFMGHTDIKITAQIYTHFNNDAFEASRYLLDAYRKKQEN